MVTIKKYPNRKLYGRMSENHKYGYLHFKDIRAILKTGKNIRIICSRTKVDLTEQVLPKIKELA